MAAPPLNSASDNSDVYRRFLLLSQNNSPATFDFGTELPAASATVKLGVTPFGPSWSEFPIPATSAPAAGAYSTQPFGQTDKLNARTVCSGRSYASAGSVAAVTTTNESKVVMRMGNPQLLT